MADRKQSASFHPTVDQSIINLLNNAADASPHNTDINVDWDNDQAYISIRDYGTGLDADKIENLGQAFVTNKADGLGLGLFLSRATLTSFGGTVSLQNAQAALTITVIIMPINKNSASAGTK